jgi:hypothetical protein
VLEQVLPQLPIGNGRFFPMTDGIFNGELRDQDDYNVIRHNLRCAFNKGSCL